MDRRSFLARAAAAAGAAIAAAPTLSAKAEALEDAMVQELDRRIVMPPGCTVGDGSLVGSSDPTAPYLQHREPRLAAMPKNPTLVDFFRLRFAPANHVLQSAALAQKNGASEKIVLACLLHDIAISSLMRTDHGYWCAQLIAPYVDEEVSWAIQYHQALRFFPDPDVGYEYPEAYIRFFGADYDPEPYIHEAARYARNHRWYMTSRMITINDLYSFEPDVHVEIDQFTDIIGRHFKQPKEGLGFDGSPVAHMWRTIIWPNNFL
jgi:hypothetical protein